MQLKYNSQEFDTFSFNFPQTKQGRWSIEGDPPPYPPSFRWKWKFFLKIISQNMIKVAANFNIAQTPLPF